MKMFLEFLLSWIHLAEQRWLDLFPFQNFIWPIGMGWWAMSSMQVLFFKIKNVMWVMIALLCGILSCLRVVPNLWVHADKAQKLRQETVLWNSGEKYMEFWRLFWFVCCVSASAWFCQVVFKILFPHRPWCWKPINCN